MKSGQVVVYSILLSFFDEDLLFGGKYLSGINAMTFVV